MPEFKKQHFIPRMYFRRFSKDNQTIEQIIIKDKIHRKVAISKVCQKNYMYAKEPEFEKFLSFFESLANVIIRKILKQEKICIEEYRNLLSYVGLQNRRTLLEKENIMKMVEKIAKETMTIRGEVVPQLKNKGISKEWLNGLKIEHPGLFLQSLFQAMMSNISLLDLRMVILVNSSQKDLIFSDNPVVLYNRVKWNDKEFSLGTQSPGLLIFFPLNSKNLLLLYDTYHYKIQPIIKKIEITGFKPGLSYFIGKIIFAEDIKKINKLQYYNCNHILLFENEQQKDIILKIVNRNESKRKKLTSSFEKISHSKGELIHVYKDWISEEINFSFLEILRKKTNEIQRSKHLSKLLDEEMNKFQKEIDKKKRERS